MAIENTIIYDALYDQILEEAKLPQTFTQFKRQMAVFFNKNSSVLQTNKDMEESIFKILNIKTIDVKKIVHDAEYKKSQMVNQFIFAIPLILLAQAYLELGKEEEAQFVYFCTFFKPYASRVSRYFKFFNEKNEAHMLYIIENIANNKFDIKKYGTVIESLQKKALASFLNYRPQLEKKTTDKEYFIIFESGIYSRVNDFLKNVAELYYDPKYKDEVSSFQASSAMVIDDDGEEDSIALDNRND